MPDEIPWPVANPSIQTCSIITRDDVKWTLGNWLLGENATDEQIRLAMRAANQMEEARVLCLELKIATDDGLRICFFPRLLRGKIREILDKMDQIDHGIDEYIERSNTEPNTIPKYNNDGEMKIESPENEIVSETQQSAFEAQELERGPFSWDS